LQRGSSNLTGLDIQPEVKDFSETHPGQQVGKRHDWKNALNAPLRVPGFKQGPVSLKDNPGKGAIRAAS